MVSIIGFLKENRYKKWTLLAYLYSLEFRFKILTVKPDKLKQEWGIRGEESSWEEEKQNYYIARGVSRVVNRICNKTKWESKCLVRALTAQRLLKQKNIHSTMYLGCGTDENGKMVAHAWLRVGSMFVTGGDGSKKYATVDKFMV
jgi:hypothetical protein